MEVQQGALEAYILNKQTERSRILVSRSTVLQGVPCPKRQVFRESAYLFVHKTFSNLQHLLEMYQILTFYNNCRY